MNNINKGRSLIAKSTQLQGDFEQPICHCKVANHRPKRHYRSSLSYETRQNCLNSRQQRTQPGSVPWRAAQAEPTAVTESCGQPRCTLAFRRPNGCHKCRQRGIRALSRFLPGP